eukprot:m.23294 g.23294  ORF g.23294 m.23294 type:complete len:271 (+) comp11362_c0_seq1:116-928(+)
MTTEYRVVGTVIEAAGGAAWDPKDDTGLLMESGEDFVFCLLRNVRPGDYEFKICVNGQWDGAIGKDGANYEGAPNMTLSLPASCHVGITHDTITRSTLIDCIDILPPGTPMHVVEEAQRDSARKAAEWKQTLENQREEIQKQAQLEAQRIWDQAKVDAENYVSGSTIDDIVRQAQSEVMLMSDVEDAEAETLSTVSLEDEEVAEDDLVVDQPVEEEEMTDDSIQTTEVTVPSQRPTGCLYTITEGIKSVCIKPFCGARSDGTTRPTTVTL